MSKCTFCVDLLEEGLPPSCVAGCPLRALEFGDRAELEARYGDLRAIYPLPEVGLTDPAMVLKPHQDAGRARPGTAEVANWEEVEPA
jgi:anaerobic dimethyl sulfoxide reductase subunit B (iron-sulfur subunit)